MNTNYEYEDIDSPASQLYGSMLAYGILISIFLKLLRADKLAGNTFFFVLFAPLFLGIYFLLPFGIIFGALSYLGLISTLKMPISIICSIVIGYLFLAKDSPVGYSVKENIKYFYYDFFLAKKIRRHKTKTHLEEICRLDENLKEEFDKKLNYQTLSIIFFVLIYFLLKDNSALRGFYDFLNYSLNSFFKFIFLTSLLIFCVYSYTKYYDYFCKKIYTKISDLVLFLEKENKFVLLKHKEKYPNYEFYIQNKNPWEGRERTNYYYFVMAEDNEIAYWIKPNLDFTHYRNVIPQLKIIGIEKFLDTVNARTKQPKAGS